MKIIYLHQYFNSPEMAGSTRSYEMARRLVAWGHEVHVVTSWRRPDARRDWFKETIDGIQVHWLPVPYANAMSFWQRMRAFTRFALRAGSRAARLGGDLVFASSTPLTIAVQGFMAARRLRVPMVFEVRDPWPEVPIALGVLRNLLLKFAARCLERFAYRNSARVVALSDGMRANVTAAGYPANRVAVIPNCADLALFAPTEEGARRFRAAHPELGHGPILLYPGALGRVNGVAYLARLAHGLLAVRPDIRIVVIGEGAEQVLVRTRAEQHGVLGVNFFMYPPQPKRVLVDAFSAASAIVSLCIDVPALWANSANKFFDALAAGRAVAINYRGWQAELLHDNHAGIVLPPDPAAAVASLLDFMASAQEVAACGAAARRLAEQRFSRDVLARQLEGVLLDAAGAAR